MSVVIDGRRWSTCGAAGGTARRQREWQRDTLVCMMSVSKGITGMAFNMLVDRGLVDVNAPVARYWQEFAQNGKESLPVRFILDHRAGSADHGRPYVAGRDLRSQGHRARHWRDRPRCGSRAPWPRTTSIPKDFCWARSSGGSPVRRWDSSFARRSPARWTPISSSAACRSTTRRALPKSCPTWRRGCSPPRKSRRTPCAARPSCRIRPSRGR